MRMTTWDVINWMMLMDFAILRGQWLWKKAKSWDLNYTIVITKTRLVAAVIGMMLSVGVWQGVKAAVSSVSADSGESQKVATHHRALSNGVTVDWYSVRDGVAQEYAGPAPPEDLKK